MMNYILFLLVILLTNIIQGITGFAGTILAMPPGLMLVGYPVAKPVLNVLGLLSGIYVFTGNYKSVCWKELRKIVAVMAESRGYSAQGCLSEKNRRYTVSGHICYFPGSARWTFHSERGKTAGKKRFRLRPGRNRRPSI
ncbi:MAG: hypothetical protein ACLUOI_34180 [Eisenbergiella sp.]